MKEVPQLKTFANAFEVRETNNYPILAICTDLNTYVIKHTKGKTPCTRLAIEMVASCFLKFWNIHTPEIAIVKVQQEHLSEVKNNFCQPSYFSLPCFGSQYHSYGKEFDKFLKEIKSYEKQKFTNKNDFLKLAFFDIWMANEDRTINNSNLLILPMSSGYEVCAIDHENCFNSGNLEIGLAQLTFEDSILAEPAIKHILGRDMSRRDNLTQVIKDAYLCIDSCKKNIDEILSFMPAPWQIKITEFKQLLVNKLFSMSWIEQSKHIFFTHLQIVNKT